MNILEKGLLNLFFHACMSGDFQSLVLFTESSYNELEPYFDFKHHLNTALSITSRHGKIDVAKFLISIR